MKNTLLLVFVMLTAFVSAQKKQDVIFTIDEKPVYVDDFIRVYNKNLDLVQDESQKNINEYLNLYIDYKLKILQAEALGLDTKKSFQKEFAGYQKQLSKKYLTNANATDMLVQEAYGRYQEEIKAKHILVAVSEAASPADSLQAYEQIEAIKERVANEGFDEVMTEVNNGRTIYGENLGWFSVFRMVYPFETVAYNTPVGEVSSIVRTRFGYHIIKVEDRRTHRGEIEVAHIMIAANAKDTHEKQQHAKQQIEQIYTELTQGADFNDIAKNFSDDKATAAKGGVMGRFASGSTSSVAFEDTAFALHTEGEISKPVQSKFGWHIIKLIKKYPIGSFKDEERGLLIKIKQDNRSKYITAAFVKELKNQYNYQKNEEGWEKARSLITDDLASRKWTYNKNETGLDKTLFTINNSKNITVKEFLDWLELRQRRFGGVANSDVFLNKAFDWFVENQLISYREENLVNENPEYAAILKEYRDGLLLFDLMQVQIWDKAKEDTTALKKYYNMHKSEYMWNKRANVVMATCTSKDTAEKVQKLMERGKSVEDIRSKLNSNDHVAVVFDAFTAEEDNDTKLPDTYAFTAGVSDLFETKPGQFVVINTTEIIPSGNKELAEVKGRVISDYQKELEENWITQLREEHEVKVNSKVLKRVKKQLN